jgi:hypothetical protein
VWRWLALGAVLGPLLFELAWIVLGVLQPATMTPYGIEGGISGAISNPISGLGVGPNAGLFNAAFVVCGLIQLVGVVAVLTLTGGPRWSGLRVTSLVLLAMSPVGLVLAGIFTLDSLMMHLMAALLLFVTPVVSFVVAGLYFREIAGWRTFGTWMIFLGSPLTLILWIVYSGSFDVATTAAGLGYAGLTERILTIEVHAWFIAMGWRAFRRAAPRRTLADT